MMENIFNLNWVKAALSAFGAAAAWLWGPMDALILVLLCMVCLDYMTGLGYAIASKSMSSAIGFKGLFKKVFIFVLVALAGMLDKIVPATGGAVRGAVCMFYVANEGLSILENAAKLGLPLPEALKKALKQMQEREGAESEE
jgi:toxin secretion/phage lysis holin